MRKQWASVGGSVSALQQQLSQVAEQYSKTKDEVRDLTKEAALEKAKADGVSRALGSVSNRVTARKIGPLYMAVHLTLIRFSDG